MDKNGFTILELMVTIAVVAVLSVIAYPMYRAYQSDHAALYAAHLFASDWRQMKERANAITSPCGLYIVNKGQYEVYDTDPNVTVLGKRNAMRVVAFGVQFGNSVEITSPSVSADIRIVPGVIDGPKDAKYFKGDIVFTSGAKSHIVNIAASGEMSVK